MKRVPCGLLVTLMGLSVCLAEDKGEWIPLFDGKTTQGWTPRAEVVRFEAKDNELHLFSKKNVWVVSDLKLADFIVEMEVKLPPASERGGFNSGLGFRLTGDKGKPKGYQLEIDLAKPGGVYGIGIGGWLYPKKEKMAEFAKKSKKAFKADEWNKLKVQCVGPHIQTFINGELIADFEHKTNLDGMFGIQHHGKGGTVLFRNMRVKNLKK